MLNITSKIYKATLLTVSMMPAILTAGGILIAQSIFGVDKVK